MAKRRTVKRLSDLVPDLLIEAQRCDEITALKTLERTAEHLAYNYGFFSTTMTFSIGDTTTTETRNNVPCYVFFTDDTEILSVEKLEAVLENGTITIGGFEVGAEGRVYVAKAAIPGNLVSLRMICTMLPALDDDVSETSAMTRGRRVITSYALYELFAIPNQPWSSPDRSGYWMRAFIEALETWNYNERLRNNTGGIMLTNNPFAF